MPIPMPYYLEKGPFLAVLEDFVAGPQAHLVDLLRRLRQGDGWETFNFFGSPTLKNPDQETAAEWIKHLNNHWFGKEQDAEGNWVQKEFDPDTNQQTGYWFDYYGDVEGIVRETLIRTLEVALGVDHDTDASAPINPTRCWQIEFFWKCSQSWFEGWVTWRKHGTGDTQGQVTVLFTTPEVEGSIVLDSPLKGVKTDEWVENPTSTTVGAPWHANPPVDASRGMWVVTHTSNARRAQDPLRTWLGTLLGDWLSPAPGGVRAEGEIVVVSPAMADGGVLADGLKYQAPS